MSEDTVPGTEGYAAITDAFTAATLSIPFAELHRDFLGFLPAAPAQVLDAGAGIGRDAWELVQLGHQVWAVEPSEALRTAGQQLFSGAGMNWVDDALPFLGQSGTRRFGFILCSGVLHHLDPVAQLLAVKRMAELLEPAACLALSLRNGPPGAGTSVSPTDSRQLAANASDWQLETLLHLEQQPSLLPGKKT